MEVGAFGVGVGDPFVDVADGVEEAEGVGEAEGGGGVGGFVFFGGDGEGGVEGVAPPEVGGGSGAAGVDPFAVSGEAVEAARVFGEAGAEFDGVVEGDGFGGLFGLPAEGGVLAGFQGAEEALALGEFGDGVPLGDGDFVPAEGERGDDSFAAVGEAQGAGGELDHLEGRGGGEGFGEAIGGAGFGAGDAALAIEGEGEGEREAEEGAAGGFNRKTFVFVAYFGRDEP